MSLDAEERVLFTKEMKETHTILVPMMLPFHFALMQRILELEGYHVEILSGLAPGIVETGLKYTHNDVCYPAQLTIGQLLQATLSGEYDTDKIALLLMQTGGGCRASNYVSLLRKALKRADMSHIPVLSFNLLGMEEHPGFAIDKQMIERLAVAILFGDLLMHLYNQTVPYEKESGAADRLTEALIDGLTSDFEAHRLHSNRQIIQKSKEILAAYAALPLNEGERVKVGIVGEIYVKFAPVGNNNLEKFLRSEGAEVVVPGLMDFVLYTIDAGIEDHRLYGTGFIKRLVSQWLFTRILRLQKAISACYKDHPQFDLPPSFEQTKALASEVVHVGTKMGEGWLLTGEMLELIHSKVNNIVCTQPFGCLPNHIVGRGMMRKIKELHPDANIVAIDYDASASQVNQENRLKLMMATARKNANVS